MPLRPLSVLTLAASTVCLVITLAGPAAAGDKNRIPHIRCIDTHLQQMVRDGIQRSVTFRRLVNQIEQSDVVVYLETAAFLTMPVHAHTRLAGATPVMRYLRVVIKIPSGTDNAISLIGHELQHAWEIAVASEVRDQETLAALYRRIGDENDAGWETQAARTAEDVIRQELRRDLRVLDADPDAEGSEAAGTAAPRAAVRPGIIKK